MERVVLHGHGYHTEADRSGAGVPILIVEIYVQSLTGKVGRQELRSGVFGHEGNCVVEAGASKLELSGHRGSRG
jgi:hypothetical protein